MVVFADVENPREGRERLEIHGSVGIRIGGEGYPSALTDCLSSLVLVRRRDGSGWSLPAGKREKGETLEQTMWRELFEETPFVREDIIIPWARLRPKVIDIVWENHTSQGFVYDGYLRRNLSPEGVVCGSRETDLVRQFSIDELVDLLREPSLMYRPEYNWLPIYDWVMDYFGQKYAHESSTDIEIFAAGSGVPVPSEMGFDGRCLSVSMI